MGVPLFTVRASPEVAAPYQGITIDVFASETLAEPPTVKASGLRTATYQAKISAFGYRFSYVVNAEDNGSIQVSGKSLSTEESGVTVADVFIVGSTAVPFGLGVHGVMPFGVGFPYPATYTWDYPGEFVFRVRRGYEGPQIVCEWDNEEEKTVKVLRKRFEYPLSDDDDADAEEVYSGTGVAFSDLNVADKEIYYYALFTDSVDGFIISGQGHTLAIDNQANPDFNAQATVDAVNLSAPPAGAVAGSRVVVSAVAASGAFVGKENLVATYNGATWDFETPINRWLLLNADTWRLHGSIIAPTAGAVEELGWFTFREGVWTPLIYGESLKDRLNLYEYLTDYDRDADKDSLPDLVRTQTAPEALGLERFNFDVDPGKSRFTMERVLKLFNLPMSEALSQADNFRDNARPDRIDLDLLLKLGSNVGYDDFSELDTATRRFIIANISSVYPENGLFSQIAWAIAMWLGTTHDYTIREYKDNLMVFGEAAPFPLITGTPSEVDRVAANEFFMPSAELDNPRNHRGLVIWFDDPFDPATFTNQGQVLDAISAEPATPTEGDKYLILPTATGANWVGQDDKVALYTASAWTFDSPSDRHSYATAAGDVYVYQGIFSTGEWAVAIPQSKMSALEWWLKNYVLPGSVILEKKEVFSTASPLVGLEDFEGFSEGGIFSGAGVHGVWSETNIFGSANYKGGFPVTGTSFYSPDRGIKVEYSIGLAYDAPGGPIVQHMAGIDNYMGYTKPVQKTGVRFKIPPTFPGASVISDGSSLMPLTFVFSDASGSILHVFFFVLGSPYTDFAFLSFAPPSPPSLVIPNIPFALVADDAWHYLTFEFDLTGTYITASFDAGYINTVAGLGVIDVRKFYLASLTDTATPGLVAPDCYMDNLLLGGD